MPLITKIPYNVNRVLNQGHDWNESKDTYALLRCALYLQSYEESHFKLGFIRGSHQTNKSVSQMTRLSESWVQIIRKLSYLNASLQKFAGNVEWIKTEPGDCILFDPRLIHSGSSIIGPKYSMILAYGVENSHYYNHHNYYREKNGEIRYLSLMSGENSWALCLEMKPDQQTRQGAGIPLNLFPFASQYTS